MKRPQPTFEFEGQYWDQGIELIAGIDEVGMGALAGPVCAAAVVFPPDKGGSAGWRRGVGHIPYKADLRDKARDNRKNPTEPEKQLWYKILRNKQLMNLKFVRQKPLSKYIVDFWCAELMLAIEVDGDTHSEQGVYDEQRTSLLSQFGVRVLRYKNSEVMRNVDGIYNDLVRQITTIKQTHPNPPLSGRELIRDSKQLTERQREKAAVWIKENAVAWAVGEASVEEIDTINIRRASHLAMQRAVDALKVTPGMLLIDGTAAQPHPRIPAVNIIKGDQLCYSIAAASILAKVRRDKTMVKLARRFPGYGWDSNKGYGSAIHLAALCRLGITKHHRQSYAPIAKAART